MKKLAIISFISLILVGSQVSAEVIRDSRFYNQDTLEEMQHEFFNNGIITTPPHDDDVTYTDYYQNSNHSDSMCSTDKGTGFGLGCTARVIEEGYKMAACGRKGEFPQNAKILGINDIEFS